MKLFRKISLSILFSVYCFLGYSTGMITSDTVTTKFPKTGEKSLLINIDPIISFVGNLLNGSSNHLFNLSSGTLLYRKYLVNNISKRYRFNAILNTESNVYQTNFRFPDLLYNHTIRSNDIQLTFAIGKEKRFHFQKFSLYTGWEFLSGISHSSRKNNYTYNKSDENSNFNSISNLPRLVSDGAKNSFHIGVAGILGTDYHFSKSFYVNMELSLPLVLTAKLINQPKYEELSIVDQKIVEVKVKETEKPTLLWGANFNSNQYFQFRAGVVF
ncbi:MAG: hypothetical protein KA341_05700 [Saprospiraceae bacterium]|nr:hypothetical protein [Saprospiraceae bacterium]